MSWPFPVRCSIFEDDYLTIANLECSLSEEKLTGSTTFQFCGAAENAQILCGGQRGLCHARQQPPRWTSERPGLRTLRSHWTPSAYPTPAPMSYVYSRDDGIVVGLYAARWLAGEAEIRAGVSASGGARGYRPRHLPHALGLGGAATA